ncbi:serine/threonine-protein kinase [Actinoallomurus vinaceus]|uniref:Serine/threonine-protein kinase n=1 Tax=Actinoallomurus vinaceus TaxID=1080074 RepID=A0ABP8USP4_9ACTN
MEGRLGAGGMGQVFLGWSPGGRRVAVKLIRPEHVGDARFRARFAREVEAARRVGGFHTAQVVDADPEADPPWLVTAFIAGSSLRQMVRESGSLDPKEVWALGAGLAEGLTAIHGCGLVHRDLKPDNVIMAKDGPRIIDFGIARDANASGLTSNGAVVGTFAFMSPEQVRADRAGPASDVFSLGCVLTYAATGRSPFDAGTIPAIVHRIINDPPRLDGMTGDLADLVRACLAKAPGDRPSVADVLARLTNPGMVRPPVTPTAPPHEATVHVRQPTLGVTRHEAGPAQPVAGAARPIRRRTLLLGAAAVAGTAAAVAVPAVAFWPESDGPRPGNVELMAFSRDGRMLAVVGGDGADTMWLCDVAAKKRTVTHLKVNGEVSALAFSPDGRTLARAEGTTIQLWDVATGHATGTLTGNATSVRVMAFSPDGRTLAGAEDTTVRFWDVATGRVTVSYSGSKDTVEALTFSPDGGTLAAGNFNAKSVRLVDTRTTQEKGVLDEANMILALAYSPDGKSLAIGGQGTRLWDLNVGSRSITLSDAADQVTAVAFSPDGKTLASADLKPAQNGNSGARTSDGVRLWDVASRQAITTLSRATGPVAFSPDGKTLATGGGRNLLLWDTATRAVVKWI